MKRKDFTIKEKTPLFGKKPNKDGVVRKVGVTVTYADGEKQTLLTPSGKGAKYAAELKNNERYTNDMKYCKTDKQGKKLGLTKAQRSFRSGYLQAQKDSAKAYKARVKKNAAENVPKKSGKKSTKKEQKAGSSWGDSRGQFIGIETNFKAKER